MSVTLRLRELRIYPLAIPMRFRFEHAAAARSVADPVVVRLGAEPPFSDTAGYGETLARTYVTHETAATVIDDIAALFVPHLLSFRATSFEDACEQIEALPYFIDGRLVTAARAAVELALIDLAGKVFRRPARDVAQFVLAGADGVDPARAEPRGEPARYSGIVVGSRSWKLAAAVRAQRCYGLRDFKLKVATEGWEERLVATHRLLGSAVQRGQATLRVDANSGWTLTEAVSVAPFLEKHSVSAIEQPMSRMHDDDLPDLASRTSCALIADESLITVQDAERLIEDGAIRVFNVRIAKNGGLMAALRIAGLVRAARRDLQLGCLVGETSLLSAAGAAFLSANPDVRFAEGAFGGFLLRDDLTDRQVRFRRGGRLKPSAAPGLGVEVSEARLERLCPLPGPQIRF